jgi:hypothetical protein
MKYPVKFKKEPEGAYTVTFPIFPKQSPTDLIAPRSGMRLGVPSSGRTPGRPRVHGRPARWPHPYVYTEAREYFSVSVVSNAACRWNQDRGPCGAHCVNSCGTRRDSSGSRRHLCAPVLQEQ